MYEIFHFPNSLSINHLFHNHFYVSCLYFNDCVYKIFYSTLKLKIWKILHSITRIFGLTFAGIPCKFQFVHKDSLKRKHEEEALSDVRSRVQFINSRREVHQTNHRLYVSTTIKGKDLKFLFCQCLMSFCPRVRKSHC